MFEAGVEHERERDHQDLDRAAEGRPDHYERHLAAEIVAMLPYERASAGRVLRLVHVFVNIDAQPENNLEVAAGTGV